MEANIDNLQFWDYFTNSKTYNLKPESSNNG